LGQKFIVDAALATDLQQAGHSDDLNDTVSYATVYKYVSALWTSLGARFRSWLGVMC